MTMVSASVAQTTRDSSVENAGGDIMTSPSVQVGNYSCCSRFMGESCVNSYALPLSCHLRLSNSILLCGNDTKTLEQESRRRGISRWFTFLSLQPARVPHQGPEPVMSLAGVNVYEAFRGRSVTSVKRVIMAFQTVKVRPRRVLGPDVCLFCSAEPEMKNETNVKLFYPKELIKIDETSISDISFCAVVFCLLIPNEKFVPGACLSYSFRIFSWSWPFDTSRVHGLDVACVAAPREGKGVRGREGGRRGGRGEGGREAPKTKIHIVGYSLANVRFQ